MKVLVTGYGGQLGYDVVREGIKHGLDMIGTTSKDLNITDENMVSDYIKKVRPDAIIHCAAYTGVDKAEDDQVNCYNVNVNGTKYLVESAKEFNAKFVYISTDYVFDGEGDAPFSEKSTANPIGYYGKTKYQGEEIVQDLLDEWFIVRISWVFGINGNNFIKTILRLSESRDELNVVGDQYGSPTYTYDLARLLIDMIQTDHYGVFHATNEGFCTWAEFAKEILKLANREVKVHEISTEKYPTRAVRPKNSRMTKQRLIDKGFKPLPEWRNALIRYLSELNQEVK